MLRQRTRAVMIRPAWSSCLVLTLCGLWACTSHRSPVDSPPVEEAGMGLQSKPQVGPRSWKEDSRRELGELLVGFEFTPEGARAPANTAALNTTVTAADLTSLMEQARESSRTGRHLQALRSATTVLRADGLLTEEKQAQAWNLLGRLLQRQSQPERARSAFQRALHLAPQWVEPRVGLARSFEAQKVYGQARDRWHEVLQLEPHHGLAHLRLGAMAFFLNTGEEGLAHLQRAEALGFSVPAHWRGLLQGKVSRAAVRTVDAGSLAAFGVDPAVRVDTGGGTNQSVEPNIIAAANGRVVAGWNDLREPGGADAWSLGVGLSFDGGLTWSDSLLRPAGNNPMDFEGDPMTAYDPRTGNIWVGGVSFFPNRSIYVARLPPGSNQLEAPVKIDEESTYDKGLLAAGPAPGNPNATRLYATYNLGLQASADLGATWSPLVPLAGGVSQHPRIDRNGGLYISSWDFADLIQLERSFDGGVTVEPPRTITTRLDFWDAQDGSRFPGRFRVAAIAYLAIDPNDDTLYCVYFDTTSVSGGQTNIDIYFVRSTNGGLTWTSPVVINGDSDPPADQFFPWLEVDSTGRLHLIYLDTRHTPQVDDQETGFFDVYYSTSTNRGDSWTEMRITTTPFSSAPATWPGFEQFLGDFLGLTVDEEGALLVYPATYGGDLDIFAQRVRPSSVIFADGFESGDVSAWSGSGF